MLEVNDTFNRLVSILNRQIPSNIQIPITLQTNLSDDLNIDSLDFCDLLFAIEEEFDVEIPPDIEANLPTVASIVAFLTNRHTHEVV